MNDIARKIKVITMDKGMNLHDLAEKAGYKYETLSVKMSRGIKSIEDLNHLLDSLDCDMVFVDRSTKKVY